jgi:ribonucleotide monophosphatase NagD (HAD superfamily)
VGRLTGIETVLLDLDGTLYVGSQVVAGAPEAVRWLRDHGLTVRFCTNTDSIAPAALADRLTRRGFETSEDELVTPVAVAARVFASAPEARVLAVAADVGGGRAVGAATVLVRSGKHDRPQPGAHPEPDAVIDSVADLPGLLQG